MPSTQEFIIAAESNLVEKCLSFARLPGGEAHRGSPLWFLTGVPVAGYNGVAGANFPQDALDHCIEAALRPFHERRLPLTWWTGPSTQPANLGARLQSFGFVHNRDMLGMSAEIDRLAAPRGELPRLAIEPVTSREALAAWLPLYAQGFSTPLEIARQSLEILADLSAQPDSAWTHFTVRQEGRIVAISSLFIHGETAGLYNLVTDPAARGHGIGAAMTLETFAAARALGCRMATLQTTFPNALRLYHRLGFEVYCKFGVYPFIRP